jgi:hypothetical protein
VIDMPRRTYDDGFHLGRHLTGKGGCVWESSRKMVLVALPSRPAKCDNRTSP